MKTQHAIAAIIFSIYLSSGATICKAEDLATKLQNLSVTIHAERSQGSGTIITRNGINFVLTAGHVVAENRVVTQVIKDGKPSFETRFKPVRVVKEIYMDDRSVGTTEVEGEIIAYSSAEYGHDIALIKLRSTVTIGSASFSKEKMATVGTELVHVGSLGGQEGSNSFTQGSVAQIGRVIFDKVFDQSSCPALPGSSGGGMFLKSNGDYIGMLVRGGDAVFNFYIPIRRIHVWSVIHHVEFIFDKDSKPDLSKVRLEDGEPMEKEEKEFSINHFLIFTK